MADRIRCIVPFCKRTHAGNDAEEEWICPVHFARVDRDLFKAYNRLHTKAVAAEATPGPADAPLKIEVYDAITKVWKQCCKQALDRGAP